MTHKQIAAFRLLTQHISRQKFSTVQELVSYMGAMQAQDYSMCKWAVGLRLPGITEHNFIQAFNDGKIIRTHILRPTWHIVSADDLYWMLALTAPQIKTFMRSVHKQYELNPSVLSKSRKLLINFLRDHNHLTRDELLPLYQKAKIPVHENRMSYLLMDAELDGHICNGKIKNNKQTYALLEERVPVQKNLPREEALKKLAQKYFESHGPATLKDFTWWSGLGIKDARTALENVRQDLNAETIDNETYYFRNIKIPPPKKNAFHLLPSFDEYLISYKNRTASLAANHHSKLISSNGIFWPCILHNGQVIGSWKRTRKGDHIFIEATLFSEVDPAIKKLIEKQVKMYQVFLETHSCTISWNLVAK